MRSSKLIPIAWMILTAASLLAAQSSPPTITKGVGLDQKLNAPVPLDTLFRDEAGQLVPLRTYFGEKPAVLALVYYRCPNLCSMTLTEMVTSLRRVAFEPGRDYNVVVASIDPAETPQLAAQVKASYGHEFGRRSFDAGWHFLTGSQDSISRLASAVGFRYRWDEPTRQFVHAGGIMVATPVGRVSRYFYGVRFAPADLRMALVEASQEKIGSPIDDVLLFCFRYDASQGRYTLAIFNVLKLAAGLTLVGLAGLIVFLMRKDKKETAPREWEEVHHLR